MRRIPKVAALAALPIVGLGIAAGAGAANAATTTPDGKIYVSKAEVQSALHWNNADFDKGALKLNWADAGTSTDHYTVTQTVGDQSWTYSFSVTHALTAVAQPVFNTGNSKQITGYTITATPDTAVASTDYDVAVAKAANDNALMAQMMTGLPKDKQVSTETTSTPDSLTVNNAPLTITPAS